MKVGMNINQAPCTLKLLNNRLASFLQEDILIKILIILIEISYKSTKKMDAYV